MLPSSSRRVLLASDMERLTRRSKFLFEGEVKFRVRGVAYGPFRPDPGDPSVHLPRIERARADLDQIGELGANAVRLYHVPPRWFLDEAGARGLRVLVGVPWTQHVAFMAERGARADAMRRVREAARMLAGDARVLGLLVGNEVPPDLVRWMGPSRVRRFLDALIETARQEDPGALLSYATFPPTEYLVPDGVDFVTFNVYLHRVGEFRKYLRRLHSLAGDRPLLLAEIGMDALRHGERDQAEFLVAQAAACERAGAAGTVLFSWCDEWHTGGFDVQDWAFGLVTRDRRPKAAFGAVQALWRRGVADTEEATPKASVVVCACNAEATLIEALESLDRLDYPDYEVILVDDGSRDGTREAVEKFERERVRRACGLPLPPLRHIVQGNHGLGVARNAGIAASAGEIVAFTDADCVADAEWLRHLVRALTSGEFAAAGGPNLAPPAGGLVEACVAAAPGAPNHVLLSDTEAEHVPGCNMAFWKRPLTEIGGFEPCYRTAGDDVDVCWRLMARGYRIGFSPVAVVWHRRRTTTGAYFSQQSGYGEAESLLRFNHAVFFGKLGGARWRGTVYGQPDLSLLPWRPVIYHGSLGLGLFQCVYAGRGAGWALLVGSLEWCALGLYVSLLGAWWPVLRAAGAAMLGATLCAGALWAVRARIEPAHDSARARLLLWFLAVGQPLVRGWARYATWALSNRTPPDVVGAPHGADAGARLAMADRFWSEKGAGRLELIHALVGLLKAEGWRFSVDPGWVPWDLEVFGSRWWCCRIRTADERHGGGKILVRVAYDLRPAAFQWLALAGLAAALPVLIRAGIPVWVMVAAAAAVAAILVRRAGRLRRRLGALMAAAVAACGLASVPPGSEGAPE